MDGRDSNRRSHRPRHDSDDARRRHLKYIAETTIAAINTGYVDEYNPASRTTHRHYISKYVSQMQRRTRFFPTDSPELTNWQVAPVPPHAPAGAPLIAPAKIFIHEMSTLQGARLLFSINSTARIGVLNFASATKPGGGFIRGARAQEESLARSSSLYASLTTDAARPFYALNDRDDKGGYYSHAMIHSPNVVLFRDDDGAWLAPIKVDVVTSPAVNAGQVRKLRRRPRDEMEGRIQEVMKERMGRILALFESQRVENLVLGSFGTGVFQNGVRAMAEIWKDLLHAPGARFATSFDTIFFTIPDRNTREKFESAFLPKIRMPGSLL